MASTPRENIALVWEFLTTVVADDDTNALSIFSSEDEVDHRPASCAGVNSEPVGASYWSALAAADLDIKIDDIVGTDQKVAVRGSVIGIPNGSLPSESWFLGKLNTSVRGT